MNKLESQEVDQLYFSFAWNNRKLEKANVNEKAPRMLSIESSFLNEPA